MVTFILIAELDRGLNNTFTCGHYTAFDCEAVCSFAVNLDNEVHISLVASLENDMRLFAVVGGVECSDCFVLEILYYHSVSGVIQRTQLSTLWLINWEERRGEVELSIVVGYYAHVFNTLLDHEVLYD